ncbi:MAG: hypothetical protein IJK99_09165 [Bacteroidales bacterium]|nr:hypothetical protein [Bacteroidales bacterium]
MSGSVKKVLICIGILLLLFGAGFLCGFRKARNGQNQTPIVRVDTLTIRDTIVDYRPKEVAIPAGFELVPTSTLRIYDEVLAAYKDSLARKPMLVEYHDTTYIAVPMSRTTFTDDKTYKCLVEGYNTRMLWHESYQDTKIITNTIAVPPHWAIAPAVSAFYVPDVFGIGLGVEAQIWRGNWQFRGDAGYGLFFNKQGMGNGWYGTVTASYNLLLK